jgi:hypothetical protein
MKRQRARKRTVTLRPPRLSKYDRLVNQTIQDYGHKDTREVSRVRTVIECEQAMREQRMTELTAQLADTRREKADAEAVLFGLGSVIATR